MTARPACPDENRLVEFVGGLLPPAAQAELDVHVDACERCRELLAMFASGAGGEDGAGTADDETLAARLPARYELREVVGTGAMAVVYAAHDRELDRKVALKLLRDLGDERDGERTARMRREAQAMARLAHPNVLPVHDVGTAGDRVYLTAELVAGKTLAAWLAAGERSWREIVDVFIQAGRGLGAAHAAGITHRDFKPSNVLVGDDGRVRVADFGLARTGPAAASVAAAPTTTSDDRVAAVAVDSLRDPVSTRTGQMIGTPAYMAPEQLAGGGGDEQSDQFAFCVSLFEALDGERPFRGATVAELIAAMAQPPPRLRRELPRHAGWIVRRVLERGLARDPAARFPGLAAVVAELEAARDRTPRRWGIVAMLGLVAVAAVAGLWLAFGRAEPAGSCSAAGDLAGVWDAPARAALVAGFAASGHPDAAALAERAAIRIDEYAARWTAMRVDACRATVERKTQSAAALDLRMRCLDDRRAELGAVVAAASHPDRALVGRALETVGALSRLDDCADVGRLMAPTPPPADDATRARIATVRDRLAHATGLGRAGRYADGLAAAAAATAEAEQIGHAPLLAAALFRRGQLEGAVGKNVEAVATLERAVSEGAAAHDDVIVARAWTAQVEIVGHRLARRDQGLVLARAADAAVIRAGRDPLLTADVAQMRGLILRGQAKYAEARAEMERALMLRRSALADGDPAIAQAVHDIAEIERMLGEHAAARQHHEQALAARVTALGGDHPLVAVSHVNLGHVFYAMDDTAAAREHYLAALAIDERSLPPDHVEAGNVLVSLGAVALAEGDLRAAESFERAGAIYRRALGAQHPLVAMVENNLGEVARRSGKLDHAVEHFARALEIRKSGEASDERGVATVLNNLGDVQRMQGDVAAARTSYTESLAIFKKLFGPDGELVAYPLMGLGALALEREHDPAKAKRYFARALAIREKGEAAPSEIAEAEHALEEAEKALR